MKRNFLSIVATIAALAFVAVSCEKDPETPTPDPDSVTLDKTELTLTVGETAKLTATANTETVTWTSSAEAVATVANGTVTAVAAGEATITVKAGTASASCKVTVTEPEPEPENDIALNFYNYNMHCNPMYEGNGIESGSNYTMEIKFFATHWHPYGKKDPDFDPDFDKSVYCNRLAQFCKSNEFGYLYRYGDGGSAGSLRLNSKLLDTSDGKDYVGGQQRVWDLNMWHTVTVAVDAETCTVYDNGEVVGTIPVADADGFKFERYEFGMTWDDGYGYPRAQDFHGYLEYIRFWTKTLTQEEVKAGLCHVDHKAEGLAACWEFNQDGGTLVPDVTGNGRDWDFTQVYNADGKKVDVSEEFKGQWVDWDADEMGSALCPEFAAAN